MGIQGRMKSTTGGEGKGRIFPVDISHGEFMQGTAPAFTETAEKTTCDQSIPHAWRKFLYVADKAGLR